METKRYSGERPHCLLSQGLKQAPTLDMMSPHFVPSLTARQGVNFNVRRDLNSLLLWSATTASSFAPPI